MQHPRSNLQRHFLLLPAAAAVALALAGCGGGGGGVAGASTTSFAGKAIDAPIAGATITFTSGAPLVDGGVNIGSVTADGRGAYAINVTLPTGSVPIFANAAAPGIGSTKLELSSYLGQSDALSAAGSLTSANLPDLDITPVSTAALAVFAKQNGSSFSTLIPASYALTLSSYRNDILAIAAAIKAVGDNLCTPATAPTSTTDLAGSIAASATLSQTNTSSTTLAVAAAVLGGNCASKLPLLQAAIVADPIFGPELDLGDVIDANVQSVTPGSYSLQAVVAETPVNSSINTSNSGTPTLVTPNPAHVFIDTQVSIDNAGNVTSTDGYVKGTLVGNLLSATLIDGQQTYSLRAKVGALPAALSSGSQAYAVQGGGSNQASGLLTSFQAALVPSGATPLWNGYSAATQEGGVLGCSSGLPMRFDLGALSATSSEDSIGGLAVCVATTATGWTMTAPTQTNSFELNDGHLNFAMPSASLSPASLVWSEYSNLQAPATQAPYILQAQGVSLNLSSSLGSSNPVTGADAFYVLGTRSVVLSSSTGNATLNIQGDFVGRLSESSSNTSDAQHSQVDH